ncbi:MAG: response regulator [Anaerolineales bacterium]|nr:response regulator [Anaerolineales bacterium]
MHSTTVILIVEDNPGDVNLLRRALSGVRSVSLFVVNDGAAAIEFLRHEGEYGGAPRPNLLLLDLSLPKMDGHQVLAVVKGDPSLKSIPVVILSGSNAPNDISRAYALNANCYIAKPIDLDDYDRVIKAFEQFWLQIAQLPGSETE